MTERAGAGFTQLDSRTNSHVTSFSVFCEAKCHITFDLTREEIVGHGFDLAGFESDALLVPPHTSETDVIFVGLAGGEHEPRAARDGRGLGTLFGRRRQDRH